jgi:hypothetical protein
MKRNRKNIKGKIERREQLNDRDSFEKNRRKVKKFNKKMKSKQEFSNQYEHELYIDNYEY